MPNNQTKAERAKLFLPFDALKGYREALREKERVRVPMPQLGEEDRLRLSAQLAQLKKRMVVRVVYHHDGESVAIQGLVAGISLTEQMLTIVKTKIPFAAIYTIEGEALEQNEPLDGEGYLDEF